MIRSIKYFLLFSLLLSITLAAVINAIANFFLDEQVIQPYLDNQMIRVSLLIGILNQSANTSSQANVIKVYNLLKEHNVTPQKFIFQVWNSKGELLLHSPNIVNLELKDAPLGFSDQIINGNDWRIYSFYDQSLQQKVVTAELYNLRRDLADAIARSNANILLVTYPAFGLLIWLIVSRALKSITRVANEISNRALTYLEPVSLTSIPEEIKPLVAELNQLFVRLKLAFERNKRFAADAAHELRTPLAALKTHVQVALMADNESNRQKALEKVIESVDRSSHVVAQLLTLSRLGEEETLTDIKPVNLHKLATDIIAYIAFHALEKNIEIELAPAPSKGIVLGNETVLGIMIRNIVDNAIRYTPPNGEVKIAVLDSGTKVIFRVSDTGPGIPIQLRDRVFERFFRILGTKASGSGLGLAIVSQIASLHHAEVNLSTPPNGVGLEFDVAFPKYHE